MLSLTTKKRFTLICMVLTIATLILIIFVGLSMNRYDSVVPNFKIYRNQNQSHTHGTLPRVLCLILTSPQNVLTRVKAVHETWAPHCDQHFFITEEPGKDIKPEQVNLMQQLPIAPIKNITAGYDHLTQKSTLALLFAHEKYLKDFDWFVKADDDTFLIVENLKEFLREQNTSEPVTFGYNFKVIVREGYHSGGASYVLSQEALRRFYEAHQDPQSDCRKDGGSEDVEIAKCLRAKGVHPGKSIDKEGRELFHPLPFNDHFMGPVPDWLKSYAENPLKSRDDCCGDRTISFHYVSPEQQYFMNFLLYKAHPKSSITESNSSLV